jgi:predicted RNase H-like nuclease (RuvC/YqgF family)
MTDKPTLHDKLDEMKRDYREDSKETRDVLRNVEKLVAGMSVQVQNNKENLETLDAKVDSTRKWNAADSVLGIIVAGWLAMFKQ